MESPSVKWCRNCLMPSSRPRIVFKGDVCNACLWAEQKKEIDWDARAKEFSEVVEQYRGSGPYDCIVPFSGGKDSATIAWRLKFEFHWSDEEARRVQETCKVHMGLLEERPKDDPPERPERFRALAFKALHKGEISTGRFSEYLGIPRHRALKFAEQETPADEEITIPPA